MRSSLSTLDKVENMINIRSALQNETSVADMFLTTEAVVADIPEKEALGMPDMGGMGMM